MTDPRRPRGPRIEGHPDEIQREDPSNELPPLPHDEVSAGDAELPPEFPDEVPGDPRTSSGFQQAWRDRPPRRPDEGDGDA